MDEIVLTENMKPFIVDENNYISFLIEVDGDTEYTMNFKIYEVNSWEGEENSPCNLKIYVRGMIKWDGCSHLNFGNENGYLHLCGKEYWDKHCEVMTKLYEFTSTTITAYDKTVAE